MKNEVKRIAFGPVPSRDLGQNLGINDIPSRIIIGVSDYKSSNCWEVMVCPENLKKARKEFNWKNTKGCSNRKFYDFISRYTIK